MSPGETPMGLGERVKGFGVAPSFIGVRASGFGKAPID